MWVAEYKGQVPNATVLPLSRRHRQLPQLHRPLPLRSSEPFGKLCIPGSPEPALSLSQSLTQSATPRSRLGFPDRASMGSSVAQMTKQLRLGSAEPTGGSPDTPRGIIKALGGSRNALPSDAEALMQSLNHQDAMEELQV